MKWILIALGLIVGLAVLVLVAGLFRPREHVARTRASFAAAPERVWEIVTDFEWWGEWSPEVEAMEREPDREGRQVWRTPGKWGEMPMEVTAWEPPRRLETHVDGGAFQGRWTYEIEADGGGSRVTITERGEVHSPFMRGMMLLHDEHASMRAFLRGLASRLGETAEPVELR